MINSYMKEGWFDMPAHIVAIDDDSPILEMTRLVLGKEGGYQVTTVEVLFLVILCKVALSDVLEQESVLVQKGIPLEYKPFTSDDLLSLVSQQLTHVPPQAIPDADCCCCQTC